VEIHERRFLSALPEHAHDEWRLVVVLAGAFDERTDSGTRQCAATSVIVRAPGEEHVDLFRAPLTRYASMTLPQLPLRTTTMSSTPLTARLTRALTSGDSARAHRLMSRILEQAIEPQPVDDRVRIARETIERDFASQLRMSALAREAGLHRATLGRAFRAAYGCTPAEFLGYTRVRAAMDALSNETPAAVALRCGFYDQSHFANAFRRVTGMTPRTYSRVGQASSLP
jgi:AraC family transcriptional regulator